MARKDPKDFRLKITQGNDSGNFIVRQKGKINYLSCKLTPLALTNLFLDTAAEMQFRLEDTFDGITARHMVEIHLREMYQQNPDACPKVENVSFYAK